MHLPNADREIDAEKERADFEANCWRIALHRGDAVGWSCAAARRRLLGHLVAAEERAARLSGGPGSPDLPELRRQLFDPARTVSE
jgi:hypothetical protein